MSLLATIALVHSSIAADCTFAPAFSQADENGSRRVPVLASADGTALMFTDNLKVNTDGTRRSYSVADFWGKDTAINNLCNAMSDRCARLDTDARLRARRELTQRAFAEGWPADLLAATRISSSIIPFVNGKPCPLVDGFLVSATALHKRNITDACDISNYVDALTVAAVVVPGRARRDVPTEFENRGVRVGDLALVLPAGGGDNIFAVVGDVGPAKELGEGTVALVRRLLGKSADPANLDEIRGRGAFRGHGWKSPRATVVIFPGTADRTQPYLTQQRIDTAANAALRRAGGVAAIKACLD